MTKHKVVKYCVYCRRLIDKSGKGQGMRVRCHRKHCELLHMKLRIKKKKWAKRKLKERNIEIELGVKKEALIKRLQSKGLILHELVQKDLREDGLGQVQKVHED